MCVRGQAGQIRGQVEPGGRAGPHEARMGGTGAGSREGESERKRARGQQLNFLITDIY